MKNSIRTSHEKVNENRNEIKRSQLLEIPCFHITPHTHTYIIHIIRIFKVARCHAHANSYIYIYIYIYTSVEIISFLEQI
jgi:hypothetical protein